jgi:AraC-like DNA-binding protein
VQADVVPISASILERLGALDVDVARVLRTANVPRSRFEGGKARVTTAEFFALWRAIEEVGGGARDLGLRIGADPAPQHQNVASMAALASPNLGEALKRLARYKRLVCPEQIVIDVVRGEARVRYEWLLAEEEAPPATLIDGIFAGVLRLARQGTGKAIAPRRIELARRRDNEAMLARHFGCKVRFDAPVDLFVFDAKALAEPFVTHNAELLEVIVPGLEAAVRKDAGGRRSLADDVRSTLSQRISGERPAVEKVAKSLGMSGRTLQRRLEELGTSYQALLDEVRQRSARRLLAKTDLDTGEVAFLLGFEELNSFTRAFHSWEGTTPARWRAAQGSHGNGKGATP